MYNMSEKKGYEKNVVLFEEENRQIVIKKDI